MPDLSAGARAGLRYFGAIWGAVEQHAPTAAIWDAIKGASASFGVETAGIDVRAVNQLRAMAADLRNSRDALTRAEDHHALDSTMIGTAPWSRDLGQQNALGMWQARFEHKFIENGLPQSEIRTIVFTSGLPVTAGDLRAAVEDDAESLADKYGTEHVGVGAITLIAV